MNSIKTIVDGVLTESVESSDPPRIDYIRIIAPPPGEAPYWVRKVWVGLVLPLSPNQIHFSYTEGAVSGEPSKENAGGFVVGGWEALGVLYNNDLVAFEWWTQNCPAVTHQGAPLVFDKSVCELIS